MTISGNKGEWSEIYTLLKLLGDGEIYGGDQNLNKIKELLYPIISIIREESDKTIHYNVEKDRNIKILDQNEKVLIYIPSKRFLEEAEKLLYKIKSNKNAFTLEDTENFMKEVYCNKLKASSKDKTDIRIILHDVRTKINSEMGFSIKSQLGNSSTLLNASKATNFIFNITGGSFSNEDIEKINSIKDSKSKVILRYKAIKDKGATLTFNKVDNTVFERNLRMIDSDIQLLMADMLIEQLESKVSSFPQIIRNISKRNPLNFNDEDRIQIYSYKAKHILTATALGMMPSKKWNGIYDANGGYIVVKEDGEIVCYHFYDKNRFEDYLFNNSFLERSSTSRHDYANIIRGENKELLFKLNLQIRLK